MIAQAKTKRRRLTTAEREAMQMEALSRAVAGISTANYGPMILEFRNRGILDVIPRENVFTYHAWRAKGRQVKRGEHGVKVITFVPMTRTERDHSTGEEKEIESRRPTSATLN